MFGIYDELGSTFYIFSYYFDAIHGFFTPKDLSEIVPNLMIKVKTPSEGKKLDSNFQLLYNGLGGGTGLRGCLFID
jgi:hypothetical protein